MPQANLLQQTICGLIGLGDPFIDAVWLGGVFEFDGQAAVDLQSLNFLQIRDKIDYTTSGWQVPMFQSIAV